jgi:hypothetical protein
MAKSSQGVVVPAVAVAVALSVSVSTAKTYVERLSTRS